MSKSMPMLKPDKHGRVRVFLLGKRSWEQRYPIDARTLYAAGEISLDGPTVTVRRDEETARVCPEELEKHLEAGWERVDPPPAAPSPVAAAGGAPGSPAGVGQGQTITTPPERFDFHAVEEDQLRLWAASQQIEGVQEMSKAELVEVLERINFEPPAA